MENLEIIESMLDALEQMENDLLPICDAPSPVQNLACKTHDRLAELAESLEFLHAYFLALEN